MLEGSAPVTCRPADLLKPELAELEAEHDAFIKELFKKAKPL